MVLPAVYWESAQQDDPLNFYHDAAGARAEDLLALY